MIIVISAVLAIQIWRLATVASHVACGIQDAAIWLVEVPLVANSRKGELFQNKYEVLNLRAPKNKKKCIKIESLCKVFCGWFQSYMPNSTQNNLFVRG